MRVRRDPRAPGGATPTLEFEAHSDPEFFDGVSGTATRLLGDPCLIAPTLWSIVPAGVNAPQTSRVEVVEGNLLKQDVDIAAIVNPANEQLQNVGGLAAMIEAAASPQFKADCSKLRPVSTGGAKVSAGGGKLKQNHVINAVGPIWQGGNDDETRLLASVHAAIVRVASENALRRVALPPISTGIFKYPAQQAAPVAILATLQALTVYPGVELVRFVMYLSNDPDTDDSKKLPLYEAALKSALAGA